MHQHLPAFAKHVREKQTKIRASPRKIVIFVEILQTFRAREIFCARRFAVVSAFVVRVWDVLNMHQHLPACSKHVREKQTKIRASSRKIVIFVEILQTFRARGISRARHFAVVSAFVVRVWGVLNMHQHLPACAKHVRKKQAKFRASSRKIVIFFENFANFSRARDLSCAAFRGCFGLRSKSLGRA